MAKYLDLGPAILNCATAVAVDDKPKSNDVHIVSESDVDD